MNRVWCLFVVSTCNSWLTNRCLQVTTILGWTAAFGMCCLMIFGLYGDIYEVEPITSIAKQARNPNPLGRSARILYQTFSRLVWSCSIAFMIFACVTSNGGESSCIKIHVNAMRPKETNLFHCRHCKQVPVARALDPTVTIVICRLLDPLHGHQVFHLQDEAFILSATRLDCKNFFTVLVFAAIIFFF